MPARNRKEAVTDLTSLYPLGQITDEGDTILQVRRLVKGRRIGFQPHDGVEKDSTAADRVPSGTPPVPVTGRINAVRDLREDKAFTRTELPVDEFGVPTVDPFDGTTVYTTANPELLTITDVGPGQFRFAAVGGGALGPAAVTFTATPAGGGAVFTKNDVINLVPGSAEGFSSTDGPDEEVTPDV